MRLQIALDYLIIFNFILFIFLVVFVVVAYQRGQAANQETFSQLQIIAQTVAAQINGASLAGNGYSAHIPLPSSVSIINYSLAVGNTGIVVASVKIGGQIVQAVSYSMVRHVISNSSFASAGNANLYDLPTANGSIELQNSQGNVCIDISCPPPLNQTFVLSLADSVTHGASVAYNGSVYIASPHNLTYNNGVSVCLWFNTANVLTQEGAFGQVNTINGDYLDLWMPAASTVTPSLAYTHLRWETNRGQNYLSVARIYPNNWYFACGTYGNGQANLYINGTLDPSSPVSLTFNQGVDTQQITIGAYSTFESGIPSNPFNGTISNVQLYNSSLTPLQVSRLYSEGIAGLPVANSIVGWWPLNGNANDSSGIGNSGVVRGYLLFPTIAQLFATAVNQSGSPRSHAFVSFSASSGNFTTGSTWATSTNSKGVAMAILTQGQTNGYSVVTATAFQGNSTIAGNLIGWWPLNSNKGSMTYDLSGNNNNGNLYNASWSTPGYVASFDGKTGFINVGPPIGSSTSLSVSSWVYLTSVPPNNAGIFSAISSTNYGTISLYMNGNCNPVVGVTGTSWTFTATSFCLAPGRWYNLVAWASQGSGKYGLYINGIPIATNTFSGSLKSAKSFDIGLFPYKNAYFPGYISNVQLYSTALTQQQAGALYYEGLAGPPLPLTGSLLGWWQLSGDAYDHSGLGNNGTIYGNTGFVPTAGFTSQNTSLAYAASFTGSSSYISGNSLYAFPIASGLAWIYPTAYPASGKVADVFEIDGAFPNSGSIGLGIAHSGNVVVMLPSTYYQCLLTAPLDQWSLAGFYINASSSSSAVYLNGQNCTLATATISSLPFTDNYFLMGGSTASFSSFVGNISNVQVYRSKINTSQAYYLFNKGILTPPLQGSGLVGWYPLNANSSDFSGLSGSGMLSKVGYNAITVGYSPNLNSFSSTGVAFNGGTSKIAMPSVSYANNGDGVAIAAWVYTNYNAGVHTAVVNTSSSLLTVNSVGVGFMPSKASGYILSGNYPMLGAWNFVTGTWNFSTGTGSLYVNGAQIANGISGAPAFSKITKVNLGYNSGVYFNGSISNVQLFNSNLTESQVYQLYDNSPPPSAKVTIPMSVIP